MRHNWLFRGMRRGAYGGFLGDSRSHRCRWRRCEDQQEAKHSREGGQSSGFRSQLWILDGESGQTATGSLLLLSSGTPLALISRHGPQEAFDGKFTQGRYPRSYAPGGSNVSAPLRTVAGDLGISNPSRPFLTLEFAERNLYLISVLANSHYGVTGADALIVG